MRKNRENQLPLSPSWPDHRLARELESISKILDQIHRAPIWFYTICVAKSAPRTEPGA